MTNACVIGMGTVGKATAAAFGITKYFSRHDSNINLQQASNCQYIFICLPTPTVNGENYTKDIYDIVKQIAEYPRHVDNVFIIRSTVYPGFNKYLQASLGIDNIVSNPEFLSEDTAMEDAKHPDIVVLGSESIRYLSRIEALYRGTFKNFECVLTDSVTAETIKYTLNAFFSTKVMFGNAIYDYTQKIGANYETIKGVLEYHKW